MAELKTSSNDGDVAAFLEKIPDPDRRVDAIALRELMESMTGEPGQMWGDSIVGFVARRLRYESGRELDWFSVGFSPRKNNLTVYISGGFDSYREVLGRLGPHTTGKGCLYLKRLAVVDTSVLRELVSGSLEYARTH